MNTIKSSKSILHKKAGFTIVELIVIMAIIGFLASLSVPSSLRWLYKEDQNAYVRELSSFLNLVRRETRRWGGSCTIKTKQLGPGLEGKGLGMTCLGMNQTSRNNSVSQIPNLKKTVFQEVNTDFSFTPKGQLSTNNNYNYVVFVVGGRHDQSAGGGDNPKCLVISMPSGAIRTGIYSGSYNYYSNRVASRFNNYLNENSCITY